MHFSLYAPPAPAKEQQTPLVPYDGFPPPPTTTVFTQVTPDGTLNVYDPGLS